MTRIKSVFKWLAMVGGGLLSAALLYFAFLNWRAGVCLDGQLQPLRQGGEPMSIAELAPAPVPPERNAATYLRRAEKSVMAINKELAPLSEKHDDYYEKGRLNESGSELVEAALAAYPDAMPLIEQAADAPDYVPDHDYTLPPQPFLEPYLQKVQQARAFARLLQYRADLLLAGHEREESLRNGLTLLRLDRHFQQEPMLVAYLVSVAVQSMAVTQIAGALEAGSVPAELHGQIDAELSKHLKSQAFVTTLISERAYGIDSFRNFRGLGLPGYFKRDECDYLKRMAAEIKIGAAPRYKTQSALEEMKANTQGAGALTRLMSPALEAAREAQVRSLARLQCLSVLNALTRQDREDGATPPSLDDLKLPDDIKLDPYNGQPLTIKRVESGWVVYSVGPNLKDDGGKIEKSEDVGVGPSGYN
jgi:hypothetical protein